MHDTRYVPVSIDLLYSGMVVPHDIYDYAQRSKLISKGSVIGDSKLERLKIFNKGHSTIYVTVETEMVMRRQGVSKDAIASRKNLEKKIGYSRAEYTIINMLESILHTGRSSVSKNELTEVSQELSGAVDNTESSIIVDLINTLVPEEYYLQRHCVNVGLLNGLFGKWLELPKDDVDMLVLTGLLHDCGKASVPRKVLNLPRGLTGIEFEVIKTHPVFSGELLSEFPEAVRLAARGHHERMNGGGYPDGLVGEDIPLMARVTAISDIYDAMTSKKPYKSASNPFVTLGTINDLRGSVYDPKLIDVFVNRMPDELIDKPVLLSDGTIGLVHSVDIFDIEYPSVKTGDKVVKTDASLYCKSMYIEESDM